MKNSAAKNIAEIGIMAAILVAGKFALSFIPNVEIVTSLIIIFTCVYGFKRVIFSVIVFCLLDNLLYAFSFLVAIQYFFHWPLLCLFTEIVFRSFKENELSLALLSAAANIVFWIETPIINSLFRFSLFLPTLMSGIPFMVPMVLGGFLFIYFGFKPLYKILVKVRDKTFLR